MEARKLSVNYNLKNAPRLGIRWYNSVFRPSYGQYNRNLNGSIAATT